MRHHKEVWKKKFKLIFILIQLSEMNGAERIKASYTLYDFLKVLKNVVKQNIISFLTLKKGFLCFLRFGNWSSICIWWTQGLVGKSGGHDLVTLLKKALPWVISWEAYKFFGHFLGWLVLWVRYFNFSLSSRNLVSKRY